MKSKICCLVYCVGFALWSIAQPDDGMEKSAQSSAINDFWAVSNSVYKAAYWASVLDERQTYFPAREVEQVRFLFDLMSLLSTSRVEVICFKSSGIDANRGHLSFWVTGDMVYKIKHPVYLSSEKYTLSLFKTVRTNAFNSEFGAFESVPLKKSLLYAVDVPCGFYTRRVPDGTFHSIYFPIVVEESPPIRPPEGAKDIYVFDPPLKIYAFNKLFNTLSALMEKPVVWSNDGTPRTVTE
jgi:hypothetical protein